MPLYAVLYQAPCAPGKLRRFMYFCSCAAFVGVCPIRKLVYIIAYGRQLTQQGGVCVRRAWPDLDADDQFADNGARAETAVFAMLSECYVFRVIQP